MLHIVTSKHLAIESLSAEIAAKKRPGYVLLDLAQKTNAHFDMPDDSLPVTTTDKLRAKLFSTPQLWSLARRVVTTAASTDTIFCTGEDIGIPLADFCRTRGDPPRLFVTVHNLNRPRGRLAMKLFRPLRTVTGWLTPAPTQAQFLTTHFKIPTSNIHIIPEQTDTHFYTPRTTPDTEPRNPRPIIASVGLEQRDYRTLAQATHDLPVDVRISGFSKDAQALHDAFPDPLPENMSRKFYEWNDLVDLYQSAAIVVVPLFPNVYVAGITTFLEGLACRRPVIATRTDGLAPYTDTPGICLTVPPNNPMALRTTIQHLLNSPPTADALATRGHAWLLANHTPSHWVNAMINAMGLKEVAKA